MKQLRGAYFFILFLILIVYLAACKREPGQFPRRDFNERESIRAPVIIKAGTPDVELLSDHAPPEIVDISQKKLPKKHPVDFFITMQNFNTEHGLALSSILSGFKDSAGNLWFGTFGNGVSKYDGQSFTNFSSAHGLPHNMINAITEDSQGNLWFSTYGGASKYNGVSFQNFSTAHGLPDNIVNEILEDSRGNIWLTTTGGLCRYLPSGGDTKEEKFIHYNGKHGFTGNYARAIIEDQRGSIWVSADRGVMKYDPMADATGKVSFSDYSKLTGLEGIFVNCMAEDRNGIIWFGTDRGVFGFDPVKARDGKPATVNFTAGDGLISDKITSIVEDSKGTLWFGSKAGVSALRNGYSTFLNLTSKQGLVNNSIICITEDGAGSIWFGTSGGGLSRFDGFSTLEYTRDQGLVGRAVFSIAEDHAGDLWFGIQDGGIVKMESDRLKTNNDLFIHYADAQGLTNHDALTMIFDMNGHLWFGSGNGLSRFGGETMVTYKTGQGMIKNSVVSLKEDSKGNIWMGIYEGGLSRFDGKAFTHYTADQGLVHNTVWSIHEDKEGALWLATRGGLSRFDGESFVNFKNEQGLPDNKLSIVTQDRHGNLLIGSWGGGVSIISKSKLDELKKNNYTQADDAIFENFNTSNGLANDVVYGILEDDAGNIMIGTSKGLTVLKGGLNDKETKIARDGIEYYNQKSGYPIRDVSNNFSMHLDSPGFVWMGTGDKLVRFDYKKVKRNTKAPNVFIKGVKINNENISWHTLNRTRKKENPKSAWQKNIAPYVVDELNVFGRTLGESERDSMIHKFSDIRFDDIRPFNAIPENLVLPYAHHNISFDFVGIETAKPFMVQYQFMLEGFEKHWNPVTGKTSVDYSNLSAGSYSFKLRARSPGGIWSEPIAYGFKVLPPWWLTWWAFLIYVSAFTLILLGVRRYELNRIGLRNQLKLEKVTTDSLRNLDQLKSQFFANISHEFRTPLTLILGQIESVMSSGIKINEKEKLQVANRNARRLLKLINELLDLSKLEAGGMELNAATQNIVSYLKSLFFSFESLAATKNIELVFETTNNHVPVLFDPDKMEKVFYNLMSNAFKFTPENGKISLSLDVVKNERVIIAVKDTGIGIPENRLANIFDRFYQVDGSATREHEGTGIGLALAKELVGLHNGTLTVKSRAGEGAVFLITLPVENSAVAESTEKSTSNVASQTKTIPSGFDDTEFPAKIDNAGQTEIEGQEIILIVEDNDDVRTYIREQLAEDYKVNEARHGEEGVMMAKENIPDLIITDVMMPKMDGYQFCNAIRQDEKTSHIPVIMLTAKSALDDKIVGLESGVDAYLTKPFSAKELRATVKNLVHQREQLRKRFSKSTVIKPSEVTSVSVDQEFLEKIFRIIETHFEDEQFSVEKLAEQVKMSISQLNRKLKALIDQPPGQMIRTFRLQRAAELLEKTSGTVSEISYKVGFSDNAYFSRAFKKQFGCSPSEYHGK